MIIGIDPGLTGGIAVYDPQTKTLMAAEHIPVTTPPKSQIVISELNQLVQNILLQWDIHFCVIERVHSMPNQGVASTFKFGLTTGILHGVIGANGIQIVEITPAVWKCQMGLGREKKLSIEKAKKLFPNFANVFTSKADGPAEAALIAYFGSRIPGGYK